MLIYKFNFKKMRQLRLKLALAKTDLAKASGVHEATIRRLESGKGSSPSIKTISRIAHGLGISPHDLIKK